MSLINNVIEAHGGMKLWSQVERLIVNLRVGGNLLAMKCKWPGSRKLRVEVETNRICIRLSPYPESGYRGVFDGKMVRVENEEGVIIKERQISLDAECRTSRLWIWDDLDLLYFLGYALWNYSLTPFYFLWPGFEVEEGEAWTNKDGSRWQTLRVTYPEAFPTHSRRQTFYFDQRHWLRRLDYTAYVFFDWTHGAHYCFDHRSFNDLVLPTHRVVFPRMSSGHPFQLFRAMEGWIDDVEIVWKQVAKSEPLL